ncbi:MAG: metallophosphoesterase family protein, partial [Alkalispirochaeta sp.]
PRPLSTPAADAIQQTGRMKILHTADWHIGKRLERFPRLEEQRQVLQEIVAITEEEDPDLVIVAGDLFDTFNPGSDAQELLYRTLRDLARDGTRGVIAIAGNHDSPDRVVAPEVLARTHGIVLVGYPEETVPAWAAGVVSVAHSEPGFVELAIDRPGVTGIPIRVLLVPYANEVRLRRALDPDGNQEQALQDVLAERWRERAQRFMRGEGINLMVAHLMFAADPQNPPEEPDGERPIAHIGGAPALSTAIVPGEVQYAAGGHLHRAHPVSGPAPLYYSGSPLSYSFAEAGQEKSVTVVEVEPHGSLGSEATVRYRPLTAGRPLLRYHAASVEDALSWLTENPNALVELSITLPDYLSGADRRRLHEAHDGIVTIVPLSASAGADEEGAAARIDPTGDIHSLFAQFFADRHGVEPDEAMRALFREVLSAAGDGEEPPA